jgi:hypothetical protein
MPILLYCKNKKCQNYKFLDEPISFSFSAIYTPFEDDKCYGKCKAEQMIFIPFEDVIKDFKYEGAMCLSDKEGRPQKVLKSFCDRIDCVHNEKHECTRPEILVDKLNDIWVCKCFAFRKIRGHTDWSALLQGGNAKGGHVSDADAEKMNKYAKTTRSYRTHMKQVSS